MTDYVNRESITFAIDVTDWYHINDNGKLARGANSKENIALYKADDVYRAIERVKSEDVIPIEFIQKRIDHLHELAEYEFEENGGYVGRSLMAEHELEKLIVDWKKENG